VKLFPPSDKNISQKYTHFFMFVMDVQFLPEVKYINKINHKSPTLNFMKNPFSGSDAAVNFCS
jgi:hypothetical protein